MSIVFFPGHAYLLLQITIHPTPGYRNYLGKRSGRPVVGTACSRARTRIIFLTGVVYYFLQRTVCMRPSFSNHCHSRAIASMTCLADVKLDWRVFSIRSVACPHCRDASETRYCRRLAKQRRNYSVASCRNGWLLMISSMRFRHGNGGIFPFTGSHPSIASQSQALSCQNASRGR